MRLTIIRTAVLALTLIGSHPARADFEAGQQAWDAGNVDAAATQWRESANDGDGRAMLELGRLYLQGLGVIQDYMEAHKWFNLAASRGVAEALKERDALAVKMTPAQLATAQQMASAWQSGGVAAKAGESASAGTGQPPPQAIRAAQSLLATLGYQPGPADGVWTPSTETAYQAFLRDAGLPQTDTLTPQVLRAMQATAEQEGVAQAGNGTTTVGIAQTAPSADTPPVVSSDALHNAVQAGDIEVLEATLVAGVDVNARDSRSWTALMHAVDQGSPLLVSMLLEVAADVNVRALDGATALFMAAAHGHTEIVELLMKAGADVSIRGPQGKTSVEVAVTRYGDATAAREGGASPALLALLEGRTWAEVEEELERKRQEAQGSIRRLTDEMVSIPGGEFRMGRRKGKGNDDEKPVHKVTVPAFRLGKHEVTFAQWDACVADGGCGGYVPDDWGWGRSDRDSPVISVSWYDVHSFIDWLNRKTGGNFRLPTEAEWEYAARAGSKTRYSWGNDIGSKQANCQGCGDSYQNTAPVGSFPANPWGLHDMHGNVWEWVQDCWNDSYAGAPTDGSAWESGGCGRRVVRGGSWGSDAGDLRSAYRGWFGRPTQSGNLGFRLAQDQ